MRSPGMATTRFTSRIPSAGDGNTMMSPRCGSAHLAICQVVNGTLRSYASLLIKIRSPSRIVGIMDPVGTSFQSATADRNGARIVTTTRAGRIHSRQKARNCCFMKSWTKRRGGSFKETSPLDLDGTLLAHPVDKRDFAVLPAVFVEFLGDLHIETAVLGDLEEPALFPPLQRLQTVGNLRRIERRLGDRIERDPMAKFLFEVRHQVKRRRRVQVERGVAVQHLVIEIDDVETDHDICGGELLHQIGNLILRKNPILSVTRVVGDTDGHFHVALLVPAADLRRALLGFQVEVNNVRHTYSAIRGMPSVRIVCNPGRHSTRRESVFTRIPGVDTSPGTPPSINSRNGGSPTISITSRGFGAPTYICSSSVSTSLPPRSPRADCRTPATLPAETVRNSVLTALLAIAGSRLSFTSSNFQPRPSARKTSDSTSPTCPTLRSPLRALNSSSLKAAPTLRWSASRRVPASTTRST